MSRSVRRHGTNISLFPFLAVLICIMGALVVLLVLMVARVGTEAETVVASRTAEASQNDKEVRERLEDAQWKRELLEKSRVEKVQELTDSQAKLAHLEEHLERLKSQAKGLLDRAKAIDEGKKLRDDELATARGELARLQTEIEHKKQEIDAANKKTTSKDQWYALIPYDGASGTRRRPIYVECTDAGIVIQPEGIALGPEDFSGPMGPGNPLDAALRSIRDHLAQTTGNSGGNPYPLLVVRPSGVLAYNYARAALSNWDDEFGYELISEDKKLTFGASDPALAANLERSVATARRRQAMMAAMAPRKHTGDDLVVSFSPTSLSDQSGSPGGGGGAGVGRAGYGGGGGGGNGGAAGPGGMGAVGGSRGTGPGSSGGGSLAGGNGSGSGSGQGGGRSRGIGVNGAGGPAGTAFPSGNGAGMGGSGGGGSSGSNGNSGPISVTANGSTGDIGFGSPESRQRAGNGFGLAGGNGTAAGSDSVGGGSVGGAGSGDGQARGDAGPANGSGQGGTTGGAPGNSAGTSSGAGGGSSAGGMSGSSVGAYGGQGGQAGGQSAGLFFGSPTAAPGSTWGPAQKRGVAAPGRGNNWGLPGAKGRNTAVTRPIHVAVLPNQLIIVPEKGDDQPAQRIKIAPELTPDDVSHFVTAIQNEIKGWGLAVADGYWKPILQMEVTPGGERHFENLQTALSGSGFGVERKNP